jgi:transcriptional regulator with XRE-family HTH domain
MARRPVVHDHEAGKRITTYIDERVRLANLTRQELYAKSGVSRDAVQSWIAGKWPPSRESGEKVATTLGVAYSDLLAAYEGKPRDELDDATLIAAFEWAINQVRGRQVPLDVRQAIAEAELARSTTRRRPVAEPPKARRRAS